MSCERNLPVITADRQSVWWNKNVGRTIAVGTVYKHFFFFFVPPQLLYWLETTVKLCEGFFPLPKEIDKQPLKASTSIPKIPREHEKGTNTALQTHHLSSLQYILQTHHLPSLQCILQTLRVYLCLGQYTEAIVFLCLRVIYDSREVKVHSHI